jgi:hypothetical protein
VKKRAKLLLFFDITKYFAKKNQKKCILHDSRAILAIWVCSSGIAAVKLW